MRAAAPIVSNAARSGGKLEVYASGPKMMLHALVVLLCIPIARIMIEVSFQSFEDGGLFYLVGFPATLVVFAGALTIFSTIIRIACVEGPAVIADDRGVTLVYSDDFIPWSKIAEIKAFSAENANQTMFRFVEPLKLTPPLPFRWIVRRQRYFYLPAMFKSPAKELAAELQRRATAAKNASR